MSEAKAAVMKKLQNMPDDILDEMEIISRLYALVCLDYSKKRCDEEGVLTDEELDEHFRNGVSIL